MNIRSDIEAALDGVAKAHGTRPMLTATFAYVSRQVLEHLGCGAYARLLTAGMQLMAQHIDRGQK